MATRTLELAYKISEKRFLTQQPVPAVLHTCKESRRVAKRIYHFSFGSAKFEPRIYFNPISDVIYFGFRVFDDEVNFMLKFFRRHAEALEDEDQIQRLALAEEFWRIDQKGNVFPSWRNGRTTQKILNFHHSFPHLKELLFVTCQDEEGDGDEDIEDKWQTHAGVSLVKRRAELTAEHQLAQEAFVSTFETRKEEFPDELFPEIVVMEYGL